MNAPLFLRHMELVKKSVLKIEYDYNFHVWGIVTTLKDFQTCWEINHALKLELTRINDLEIQNIAKGRQLFFGLFSGYDRYKQGQFHLVANKYFNEYLIPEMKEVDFFFKYDCETADCELDEIYNKLRSIKRFTMVIKVNPAKLKSRQNLIID